MIGIRNPESLESWLEVATRGLCRDSQMRIREEVEAHYVETLRGEIAKGGDGYEAVLTAERSLGDARVARRQFRRRHLTKPEESMVECLSKLATGPYRLIRKTCLVFSHLYLVFMMTLFLWSTTPSDTQFAAMIVIVPLLEFTTLMIWNPPKRLDLPAQFEWRACVAVVDALLYTAALVFFGSLSMFGTEDDLLIWEQLYSDCGFRVWFGLVAVFSLWSISFNLKIARKVRGHNRTLEAK